MKRVIRGLALLLLLVGVGGGLLLGWASWSLMRPFQGYPGDEVTIEIAPGSDARAILRRLEAEGVLADSLLARIYLVRVLGDPTLKAGEYRFAGAQSTPQVLDRLVRGEVVTHAVTVVEGLTLEETAALLAESGFGRLEGLLEAMRRPDAIADLDPEAPDLEGYLFPDTYTFARGTSEARVVEAMTDNFRRRYESEVLPLLPAEPPATRELVSLASLVEKEAQRPEERAIIAGVYANRLRQGMALYADPTVIFALKKAGRWDGNIRRPDLRIDSPYNTYLHPGLPPGPIASPGLASLVAAARPAEVPYLYFVSRNDGSHVFATTLAEHNRNVHRWQKLYWQRRWAEERRKKNAGHL